MDGITQTQEIRKQLSAAKRRRNLIIAGFVSGLVVIGVVVAVTAWALNQGDFGLGFLTEMIGSAVTLVLLEVVFNRIEQRAEDDIMQKQQWLDEAIRMSAKHVSEMLVPQMVANSLRAAFEQSDEVNAEAILQHLHKHNLIKDEHLDEFRRRSQGEP
jgi:hypothetical protein